MSMLPGLRGGIVVHAFVAQILTFALTAGLVALTIRVCRRYGWIALPRQDRWHRGAACLFGGVPVCLGLTIAVAVALPASQSLIWKVFGISWLMFLLGLADDIFHLPPKIKLVVQFVAALLLVSCGVVYPASGNTYVAAVVTIIWIVGNTNAFNLLDNMDGLSAGVGLIGAFFLFLFCLWQGNGGCALFLALTSGAYLGFLVFNLGEARIFMGDAGSLFIGILLAGMTLLCSPTQGSPSSVAFCIPALVLAVPIFDTFFVSVSRHLRGQPITQGGIDHTSHTLVKLGFSEEGAVLFLYCMAALSGTVALSVCWLSVANAVALIAGWLLVLLVLGIHLFQEQQPATVHAVADSSSFTLASAPCPPSLRDCEDHAGGVFH